MPGLSWKARRILRGFEEAGGRPGEGLAPGSLRVRPGDGRNATADGIDELRQDGLVAADGAGGVALTDAGYDAVQEGAADGGRPWP